MRKLNKPALAMVLASLASVHLPAQSAGQKTEVMHWWTSGGESAAVAKFADAYRAAGGTWADTAIAGGDQARSVAINRMVGGNPPTAAQFNISRQFQDVVEQDMLNNVDEIAARENWDKTLPEPIRNVLKIKGHYYAVPVNIHMPTWIWYSKSAFKKAGIDKEPVTPDEMFAALDKLKAAGLIPLAHGGQAWQETIVFMAMLANVGGKDLYLSVIRDRDTAAMNSEAFRKVLLSFKRLHSYVDTASPGRNWNDSTALLINGKAGMQIMGDWVMGEFVAAKQVAGREYGCMPGLGPKAPYLIQGDVFVFPKSRNAETIKAQKLLASIMVAPGPQLEFNKLKGSIPVRNDADPTQMNLCAKAGMEIMKDKSRHAGIGEIYLTPDQNGALTDVLTAYWNTNMTVEKAQKNIIAALKN
ncbi:ABC transporter substrate-binding protein [Undibacterium umbellatum]|uniref:Probable sugar-binding periplasmic protein n=1 Tax=Undibacterium umbellatum TaxID=2762300 RepID=A0ABR6Z9C3_9BURK|nr:ABC transporter substrate-binding protein [Undibacterium umbellatum]MBC3908360.1 carbohydrate ABC transporter substrate-binding protein [Undibacterium umbellatum]